MLVKMIFKIPKKILYYLRYFAISDTCC